MDPFSSFDLFRRRVDQMFADFDQQMFGVDPFDSPFFNQQQRLNQSSQSQSQPSIGHEKFTSLSSPTSNPKEDQERVIPHQQEQQQQQQQQQQQSLISRPSTSVGLFGGWPSSTLLPSMKVDLIEEKDRFLVNADVPGFNKDQIQVSVKDGMLTVNGKTSSSTEENDPDRKYHRVERSSGSLCRSIRLPKEVKEDEISATCENGVLKLVLPKDPAKEKKEREIRVQ